MGESRTRATYIAFLRGINVGGKNKLPMRELVALLTDAGLSDVRTYIQSGNVVFRAGAGATVAARLGADLAKRIADGFGLRVPVVVRTAAELGSVVRGNPFLRGGGDAATLHVAFLADAPHRRAVSALDPKRSPEDEFVVKGKEIYLRLANGVGQSKLTNAYFDSKLGTTSTMRNWRTVLTLLELAEG